MANNRKLIPAVILIVVLLLASCAGQQVDVPEPPPVEQATMPEPSPAEQVIVPEPEEIAASQPEYEYVPMRMVQAFTIPTAAAQLYYDLFSSMEIIEFRDIHGYGDLWSHSFGNEVRLTKQVFINRIEGLQDPVLVLAEYIFRDDGITIFARAAYTVFLNRENELCNYLSSEEFELIFRDVDGRSSWARDPSGTIRDVFVTGENLFFLDFSGDALELGDQMDELLDYLREQI